VPRKSDKNTSPRSIARFRTQSSRILHLGFTENSVITMNIRQIISLSPNKDTVFLEEKVNGEPLNALFSVTLNASNRTKLSAPYRTVPKHHGRIFFCSKQHWNISSLPNRPRHPKPPRTLCCSTGGTT